MSTKLKYILIALVVLVVGTIAVIMYRMFWQFDQKDIHVYAKEEAAKYKDSTGVYTIILEGVNHILASHSYTNQILNTSKATGTDKEQLLVQAAVKQCIAFGYLPAK